MTKPSKQNLIHLIFHKNHSSHITNNIISKKKSLVALTTYFTQSTRNINVHGFFSLQNKRIKPFPPIANIIHHKNNKLEDASVNQRGNVAERSCRTKSSQTKQPNKNKTSPYNTIWPLDAVEISRNKYPPGNFHPTTHFSTTITPKRI